MDTNMMSLTYFRYSDMLFFFLIKFVSFLPYCTRKRFPSLPVIHIVLKQNHNRLSIEIVDNQIKNTVKEKQKNL